MHGSWNHSKMVGYKITFARFENGKPLGPLEDILTGFIANENAFEAYGRPAGVTSAPDGSLLVADDAGGKIWRIKTAKRD
jgi:glucose/arabinose dehydrogenase